MERTNTYLEMSLPSSPSLYPQVGSRFQSDCSNGMSPTFGTSSHGCKMLSNIVLVVISILFCYLFACLIIPKFRRCATDRRHAYALRSSAERREIIECESTKDLIKDDVFVVVLFHADWCPHCRQFMPHYDELAKVCHEEIVDVQMVKMNDNVLTDSDKNMFPGLVGYPTMLVIHNGHVAELDREETHVMKEKLVKHIEHKKSGKDVKDSVLKSLSN